MPEELIQQDDAQGVATVETASPVTETSASAQTAPESEIDPKLAAAERDAEAAKQELAVLDARNKEIDALIERYPKLMYPDQPEDPAVLALRTERRANSAKIISLMARAGAPEQMRKYAERERSNQELYSPEAVAAARELVGKLRTEIAQTLSGSVLAEQMRLNPEQDDATQEFKRTAVQHAVEAYVDEYLERNNDRLQERFVAPDGNAVAATPEQAVRSFMTNITGNVSRIQEQMYGSSMSKFVNQHEKGIPTFQQQHEGDRDAFALLSILQPPRQPSEQPNTTKFIPITINGNRAVYGGKMGNQPLPPATMDLDRFLADHPKFAATVDQFRAAATQAGIENVFNPSVDPSQSRYRTEPLPVIPELAEEVAEAVQKYTKEKQRLDQEKVAIDTHRQAIETTPAPVETPAAEEPKPHHRAHHATNPTHRNKPKPKNVSVFSRIAQFFGGGRGK
jgi:hypothetical protein